MTISSLTKVLAVFFLSLVSICSYAHSGRFLVLSDIHYNKYDTSSSYPDGSGNDEHTDSNLLYLSQVIGSAVYTSTHDSNGNNIDKPDFILINGDFVAHHYDTKCSNGSSGLSLKSCLLESIEDISSIIKSTANGALKDIPIFPVLGNNDSDIGNYVVSKSIIDNIYGVFLGSILPNIAYVNDNGKIEIGLSDGEKFKKLVQETNGAYTVKIPDTNLYLMVLNTVLYANKDCSENCALQCYEKINNNLSSVNCDKFRGEQQDYVQDFIIANSNKSPEIVATHIAPSNNLGMRSDLLSDSFNYLYFFDSSTTKPKAIISGHWHYHNNFLINDVNVYDVGSITYRKGVVPEYNLFTYGEYGDITKIKTCKLTNQNSINNKPLSSVTTDFSCN